MPGSADLPVERVFHIAEQTPGVRLLVLFGSRARGDAHARSDWDFGYLAGPDLDVDALRARLVDTLATDSVDLADLERASGLLRYRAARDGRVVFESPAGTGDRFRLEAATFWCDAAPVLQRGYDRVLEELTP
jgi:predicted nucleotidyltransferase